MRRTPEAPLKRLSRALDIVFVLKLDYAIIRWILEFSERPGENLNRTFDPAHDRTLKLLAECLWAKRKCDEAWKIHENCQLEHIQLSRGSSPRRKCWHLAVLVNSVQFELAAKPD